MRVALVVIATLVVLGAMYPSVKANSWRRSWNYARDFAGGTRDMYRAYRDMNEANTIGADKYFHARGNFDAARRGTGGRHAATALSNIREWSQQLLRHHHEDSAEDQEANRWGRNGGDPNRYRTKGLDPRY